MFTHEQLCLFQGACRDGRLVAGGGACELELSRRVASFGETLPGMEQYAVAKFAEALTHAPRQLAENSGVKGRETVALLTAAHEEGKETAAFDIDSDRPAVVDAKEKQVCFKYYLHFDLVVLKVVDGFCKFFAILIPLVDLPFVSSVLRQL